jgi:sec-independent protein translocase protein TatA
MGLGGISIGSLLLIFLIVLLLFGTKKLRNMGEDLGQAVRSFRKGLQETEEQNPPNKDKTLP